MEDSLQLALSSINQNSFAGIMSMAHFPQRIEVVSRCIMLILENRPESKAGR